MQPLCHILSKQRSIFTDTSATVRTGPDGDMVEKLTIFDQRFRIEGGLDGPLRASSGPGRRQSRRSNPVTATG